MEFTASMGRFTKIVTLLVTLLLGGIAFGGIAGAIGSGTFHMVWVAVLPAVVYGGILMYRPLRYSVTANAIIIHRPFDTVSIDRSRIVEVAPVAARGIRFAIRTFGVGGVFGYFGSFYTSSLGSMTWYLTRLDKAVMIRTDKGKVLVSPDDVDGFIASLAGGG